MNELKEIDDFWRIGIQCCVLGRQIVEAFT